MKREWQGVITNARLVNINGHRCVRAKFVEPLQIANGTQLNLKGQTFNIGPVKRINRTPGGAIVYTSMGRYHAVGGIA